MYVLKNNIRLNFSLTNGKVIVINHRIVTPILVEKISKISKYVNKFDFIISTTDFSKSTNIFERIIKNDEKIILQQFVYEMIITCTITIVSIILISAKLMNYSV